MQKMRICFVTEADHDIETGGAVITDRKTRQSLSKLGDVDVIYLGKTRYKSLFAALTLFVFSILRSFSKCFFVYFSRGLIGSFVLISLRPFHHRKVVYQALSVPFPSSEIRYLTRSKIESVIQYHTFRFLERNVLRNADAITIAAEDYANELIQFGVRRDKVHTVPFYVEDEFFKQPIKQDAGEFFSVCYAGYFQSYHDLLPLIEAFDLIKHSKQNTILLLVGNGVMRKKIEQEVMERNLQETVSFVGKLPHSSVPSFLSAVDAFVFLTRKTGISTSLLEAAAAGKAIITLKRAGDISLDRYFRHKKEIYMVNDISPAEIARAIEFLCSNAQLRSALALGAKKVAQQYFSEFVALSQLRGLLVEISKSYQHSNTF